MKKLGISPGPIYKTILEDVENKQLAGQLEKYSDVVSYVQQFCIAKDIAIRKTI